MNGAHGEHAAKPVALALSSELGHQVMGTVHAKVCWRKQEVAMKIHAQVQREYFYFTQAMRHLCQFLLKAMWEAQLLMQLDRGHLEADFRVSIKFLPK